MSNTEKNTPDRTGLPADFFERLTPKQEILLEILADAEGRPVRGVEIRQQMRENYNMSVPNQTGALNGVLSGLTRKYSRGFRRDLIPGRWVDETKSHVEFQLGPKYEDEIRDYLG